MRTEQHKTMKCNSPTNVLWEHSEAEEKTSFLWTIWAPRARSLTMSGAKWLKMWARVTRTVGSPWSLHTAQSLSSSLSSCSVHTTNTEEQVSAPEVNMSDENPRETKNTQKTQPVKQEVNPP